jgi:hypothetical protein
MMDAASNDSAILAFARRALKVIRLMLPVGEIVELGHGKPCPLCKVGKLVNTPVPPTIRSVPSFCGTKVIEKPEPPRVTCDSCDFKV